MRTFALVLIAFFLVACQKAPRPTTHTEITVRAKPQKKQHRYSRYGNLANYRVSGKTYQVKAFGEKYHQTGLASWYGEDFHRKRTSSGEVYDMFSMTAAHKTLPLPTYLKVKNLENGKEVVVKVNDRGPFHKDRIIDLSYAAAKALGMVKKGVSKVFIETIKLSNRQAKWFIQVGAFSSKQHANYYASKLLPLVEEPVFIEETGPLTLVHIGPLENKSASLALETKLNQHGYKDIFSFMR